MTRRLLLRGLAGLAVAVAAASSTDRGRLRGDEPDVPSRSARTWRSAKACGVNCLYILLRLHGRDPDYAAVERRTPVGEDGTSLLELQRGAESFGLPLTGVRAKPQDLATCPLPAIAHFEEELGTTGHYVVVTEFHPGSVCIIDGTTAMRQEMALPEFQRRWTGYLLLPRQAGSYRLTSAALWLLVSGVALSVVAIIWRRRTLPQLSISGSQS